MPILLIRTWLCQNILKCTWWVVLPRVLSVGGVWAINVSRPPQMGFYFGNSPERSTQRTHSQGNGVVTQHENSKQTHTNHCSSCPVLTVLCNSRCSTEIYCVWAIHGDSQTNTAGETSYQTGEWLGLSTKAFESKKNLLARQRGVAEWSSSTWVNQCTTRFPDWVAGWSRLHAGVLENNFVISLPPTFRTWLVLQLG